MGGSTHVFWESFQNTRGLGPKTWSRLVSVSEENRGRCWPALPELWPDGPPCLEVVWYQQEDFRNAGVSLPPPPPPPSPLPQWAGPVPSLSCLLTWCQPVVMTRVRDLAPSSVQDTPPSLPPSSRPNVRQHGPGQLAGTQVRSDRAGFGMWVVRRASLVLKAEWPPMAGFSAPKAEGVEPARVLGLSVPICIVGTLATQVWRAGPLRIS